MNAVLPALTVAKDSPQTITGKFMRGCTRVNYPMGAPNVTKGLPTEVT